MVEMPDWEKNIVKKCGNPVINKIMYGGVKSNKSFKMSENFEKLDFFVRIIS